MNVINEARKSGAMQGVLAAQLQYAKQKSRQSENGLTIPEAFVRGIRHIGYRSNADALAELIDNSIQAYSQRVDLIFGYDSDVSLKKPSRVAVVDDGHGLAREMLRLAMMWGGTHRENDRMGLGRYGYGLPCSAVSIGRRFTIISKILDGELLALTLDLDSLEAKKYCNAAGDVTIPAPKAARLPAFVREHLNQTYPDGWHSGTIILIEKLDRLDWATTLGMRTNLVRHFGVTYHKLATETVIYVDSQRVEPIDPLFLSPNCALYSLDEDRARPLDRIEIKIRNPAVPRRVGRIVLRYSWLPPSFGAVDKSRDAVGVNANTRFPILKDYHGIIFSRNGRIIDVQTRVPWTVFINNDRYIRVEVEFSATLDEMFGVTTSKQQVSVSSEIWDVLREAGLHKAIEQLRKKVRMAKVKKNSHQPQIKSVDKSLGTQAPMVQSEPRKAKHGVSLFINGEFPLSLNTDHPLLQGLFENIETADALRSLVNLIVDRANSSPRRHRTELFALLRDWATKIGYPLLGASRP